ncbi:hypothetical protein [Stutzerimonas balearica]|uniref:hypothetical protein n=1 Tax=Stutzerimonas balearica TaxID=74829 RepID=UPI0022AF2B98|nr:hypothetical protein [Stutzerimonas balearica]MCZ4129556.1 hypothetical protein [Stutzerimonas balearica]
MHPGDRAVACIAFGKSGADGFALFAVTKGWRGDGDGSLFQDTDPCVHPASPSVSPDAAI